MERSSSVSIGLEENFAEQGISILITEPLNMYFKILHLKLFFTFSASNWSTLKLTPNLIGQHHIDRRVIGVDFVLFLNLFFLNFRIVDFSNNGITS
mgnify:CR=1 FL=1